MIASTSTVTIIYLSTGAPSGLWDTLKDPFLVVLGFVLGLIGTWVSMYFQARFAKKRFKRTLYCEMVSITKDLIFHYHTIVSRLGMLSVEDMRWVLSIMKAFDDFEILGEKGNMQKMGSAIQQILVEADKDKEFIPQCNQIKQMEFERDKPDLHFKPVMYSYTQQNLQAVSSFSESFQGRILSLLRWLNNVNMEIEKAKYFIDRIYECSEGASSANHVYVRNLRATYSSIAMWSKKSIEIVIEIRNMFYYEASDEE